MWLVCISMMVIYLFVMTRRVGQIPVFGWIWPVMMMVILFLKWAPLPDQIHLILTVALGICLFIYSSIGIYIAIFGHRKPEKEADVLIILGARVIGTKPANSFYTRIYRGYEYLNIHPKTRVIASGGQGSDEGISEARCIYETLVDLGVDGERIQLEDTSRNTVENLKNSMSYIKETEHVYVVTNVFHLYRAVAIARKLGMKSVDGLGSPADSVMILHYYIREITAVIYYRLKGYI